MGVSVGLLSSKQGLETRSLGLFDPGLRPQNHDQLRVHHLRAPLQSLGYILMFGSKTRELGMPKLHCQQLWTHRKTKSFRVFNILFSFGTINNSFRQQFDIKGLCYAKMHSLNMTCYSDKTQSVLTKSDLIIPLTCHQLIIGVYSFSVIFFSDLWS